MTRDFPLTQSDIRDIADRMDAISADIGGDDIEDGSWKWGLTVDIFDDAGDVVGQVRPHYDGWLGFYPRAIEQRDNRIFGG